MWVSSPRRRPCVRRLAALLVSVSAVACGSATTTPPPATPSASPTPSATPTPTPCDAASILASWPTERLAGQTVVVPVDEGHVLAVKAEVAAGAGGVILFGSAAPADLAAQLAMLTAAAPGGIAPLVMTDEEGGAVQRMANLVGSIPSARAMAASMSAAAIQQLAHDLATRMRASGVTMDLAPVLDVDGGAGPNSSDADGTRSFSADERVASADGLAFAAGLSAGGVVPVVKHFPGLGGATGNTDVTPAATPPWSTLQSNGLLPFRDAVTAHLPAVMVANATVPGLTATPASLSAAVIQGVLRGQLGFQGLVMTDSLSATAVQAAGYSVPRATVAALVAGADMVLFTADASQVAAVTGQAEAAVVAAVAAGTLARGALVSAVARVLAVKGVDVCASS